MITSRQGINRHAQFLEMRLQQSAWRRVVLDAQSSCGSNGIQLMPYDDTPNAGGVYKVWITRVADFHAACDALPDAVPGADCGLAGFVPGSIKTDNFRIREATPPPPTTGSIEAIKFYDGNANGAYDDGETFIEGWEMILDSLDSDVLVLKPDDIIPHLEELAAPAPSATADDAPFAWPYSHNPDRTCHEEEVSTPRTPLRLVR